MSERVSLNICPRFNKAFKLLGKKWNGLIIDVLMKSPMRFCELTDNVEGISDRLLIERLNELAAENIVIREIVQDGQHEVAIYRLTDKGEELAPVFSELHDWASKWMEPEE
ncbi:winged helix-turn-helix transcriptional regulator [Aerococcus suis]|uniref:Transcriptional regulator, HxlR family n=1 Tax=Aerococcus suis TaxID=371602 RepID=A0A1W1Y1Y5_9LACT|nr:helix-turn-helix domain-containing protein [Aerococcus suis]MCI7239861.1 helix-turn-helix transcriptional regulator [Aerococcus suis]MDD7757951.1 helix-turn-helix domain-containing protein [Aerococcus suis]MDY4647169.1 helix-turn-helix domain-containing protein [Aerococcus suis]SMC30199.1 transcriptional regulator, HxlR family [Aerococcus suis]